MKENLGSVRSDYEYGENGDLIKDVSPPVPDWLRELIGVDCFCTPVRVELKNAILDDLSPLTSLKNLERL